MGDMDTPKCFAGPVIFALWREADEHATPHAKAQHVCTDCLPSFQRRMVKCDRCEHPETIFSFRKRVDGEDEGFDIRGLWEVPKPRASRAPRIVAERPPRIEAPPAPVESTGNPEMDRELAAARKRNHKRLGLRPSAIISGRQAPIVVR